MHGLAVIMSGLGSIHGKQQRGEQQRRQSFCCSSRGAAGNRFQRASPDVEWAGQGGCSLQPALETLKEAQDLVIEVV